VGICESSLAIEEIYKAMSGILFSKLSTEKKEVFKSDAGKLHNEMLVFAVTYVLRNISNRSHASSGSVQVGWLERNNRG